jgi:cytochrome P450
VTEKVDAREAEGFFLNDPSKLDDPFPDFEYFRENRPVFYYPPVNEWFVFGYDDVASLFSDARLSADRMKGFVDAAPAEVREDLRRVAPYLEMFVLMNDGRTTPAYANSCTSGSMPRRSEV